MAFRYADPALLDLVAPPAVASRPYEDILADAMAKMEADLRAAGIPYDVGSLETDPSAILTQSAAYRDLLRRREIDDAVARTYLGLAKGPHLDARAADYGVLRRSLPHGIPEPAHDSRPASVPPAWSWDAAASLWREDDDSLRLRARLAWEALSVAGPPGAYAYHAADAHPAVDGVGSLVIGPETGLIDPGEVLLVIQSHVGDGVPTIGVLEAVAARLDAYEIIDAAGASTIRPARDRQSVRPLGARVTVRACQPLTYAVTATLYVMAGQDPAGLREISAARLSAYAAARRRVGMEVPRSGLIAALHVAGVTGLPVLDEVGLASPAADVVPTHLQLPRLGTVTLTTEVR